MSPSNYYYKEAFGLFTFAWQTVYDGLRRSICSISSRLLRFLMLTTEVTRKAETKTQTKGWTINDEENIWDNSWPLPHWKQREEWMFYLPLSPQWTDFHILPSQVSQTAWSMLYIAHTPICDHTVNTLWTVHEHRFVNSSSLLPYVRRFIYCKNHFTSYTL